MTFDFRAVITDEMPGVKTVVVRTWLTKAGADKTDERAFLIPILTVSEDSALPVLVTALNQQISKMTMEAELERGEKYREKQAANAATKEVSKPKTTRRKTKEVKAEEPTADSP